ncbi:hypothetical protein PMZ80_010722 [Knufia obscura]|uniref:Uncharacterized protein n=2 Tax=Knufia TaxID=430999 RepID=A0AAN8EA72_9EURO|nr:hypothetical protein PMZ80_010722 [Knufia obscura]KAK5949758.1 hypothetical protein OHC33_009147 [Knufia fluminis]
MSSKLLGLPAELRIRIYAFVIGGSPASVLVEANGCYHRILECSLGPLFAISQQIREEASPRLRCTLSIYRENPVAFDETTLTAPFDNYRSTLSVLVRSSTSIIVIASTAGVREQFFNNKQFPNLELLIVDCPVTMRRDVNLGTARGAKGHLTLDSEPAIVPLPPNATADRIMHGKYDANFFNAARRRVGRTTIWEVFPGAWERRFAIHCRARASIWWADRTHIRKKIIGFAVSLVFSVITQYPVADT